jgi:hypothetical protein
MTILYGFKIDPQGRIMYRLFDKDRMPADWFDAPDKAERSILPPPVAPVVEPRKTLTLDPRFEPKKKRAK